MFSYKLRIYFRQVTHLFKQNKPNHSIISASRKMQYTRNIFTTWKENSGCWVIPEKKSKTIKFTYLIIISSLQSWEWCSCWQITFGVFPPQHLPTPKIRTPYLSQLGELRQSSVNPAYLLLHIRFLCFLHSPLLPCFQYFFRSIIYASDQLELMVF